MSEQTPTITAELKAQCIREALEVGNATAVARRHQLPPRKVQQWVQQAARDGAAQDPRGLSKHVQHTDQENRHLKELLGERDLQIAILQDLIKKVSRVPLTDVT